MQENRNPRSLKKQPERKKQNFWWGLCFDVPYHLIKYNFGRNEAVGCVSQSLAVSSRFRADADLFDNLYPAEQKV